jgi:hypothetical protein
MFNKLFKYFQKLVAKPQKNVDTMEDFVDVIVTPEVGDFLTFPNKSELNQVTVKTTDINDLELEVPVKKKRTYTKKTTKPAEKTKEPAPKKTEKNATKKRTNRKPPKKDSTL